MEPSQESPQAAPTTPPTPQPPEPAAGNTRRGLFIAGGAAVLLGAWLGTGVYAGFKAEDTLKAWQSAPHGPGTHISVTQLEHQRGLLQSSGHAEVALVPGCESQPGQDEPIRVRVDYTVAHWPSLSGLVRFDWRASPTGDAAEMVRKTLGVSAPLTGSGTVSASGRVHTAMAVPELSVNRAGSALQVTPSQGFLSIQDKALAFGWTLERVVMRGQGHAVELKQVAVDLDLQNRYLGTGTSSLKLGSLSAGFGSAEGLALTSKVTEQNERLDMTVRPSVQRLQVAGKTAQDLALEWGVQGVHARSVETLSTLFSASCGMQSFTAQERGQARQALETLLVKGFSMGITQLAGRAEDSSVSGKMLVTLAPAKSAKFSLAAQLSSEGHLVLNGPFLITPEQRDTAINLGFALAEGKNGLQARYEYREGLLKVNDRSLDAGGFMVALEDLDHKLAVAWQDSPDHEQATAPVKVAQAPVEAPADVATATPPATAPVEAPDTTAQAPAQAPTAAPPSATAPASAVLGMVSPNATTAAATPCQAWAECVQQSLAAGRQQDLEAVRRLASQLDALPKPDLGNRAVSRRLNTEALDALKRDDAETAVQLLQKARRENGRDVEIAANLGYAQVKAGKPGPAATSLQEALVLDPRRTSTWTPLAEALMLSGREEDAQAALWIAYQWSSNREKSLAFYQDRAAKETQPRLQALYAHMAEAVQKP